MFLIYGMFTTIGTAFRVALLPETKNKTLQEIEHNYIRNGNIKWIEIKFNHKKEERKNGKEREE